MNLLWRGKFEEFNHFQSEMANVLCHSDDNVVVSAPTGAGKSTIFEMAMARFFTMDLMAQEVTAPSVTRPHSLSKARKILYIAPSKALCEERYEDWSRRFQTLKLGIEVAMITGDAADPGSSFGDLISAHFVIATPEKWDSMTRRWSENFFLMASVKLLLVDEVHLLGDETRGWCLEVVVTRMKTIHRAAQAVSTTTEDLRSSSYPYTNPSAIKSTFRMVAVSATLPNIAEVADFFLANEAYAFDDSFRPIPLAKHVMAMGQLGKNEWKFWSSMVSFE
jgi:ATP-dependent DNA helicase HFM1/MER3